MAEGALLSVVVTVLNEAASVRELHRRVVETLGDRDFELIFVDDGSTDGTFGELRALCADDSRASATSGSIRRCTQASFAREALRS